MMKTRDSRNSDTHILPLVFFLSAVSIDFELVTCYY
jgi:hypothetical protein